MNPAAVLVGLVAVVVLLGGGASRAQAADMKVEAILLWGTDDSKPPEGKAYKPVSPELMEKLKGLGIKWAHWFEVRRAVSAAPLGVIKEVPISDKCQLKVKNLNSKDVEVCLVGKSKEVMKRKQALPKGEILFVGGNSPGATAWLVALKRLD